jgi:peptide/nickel transport system substrate-binding protein
MALFVGCKRTPGTSPGASEGGDGPEAGAQTGASGAPVRIEPAGRRSSGFIAVASNEPRYLNPVLEPRFNRANPLIFEGLVGLDARGELIPRLVRSWHVSADGKTITFKLRDRVSWHDGAPLRAQDVAFTFAAIRATEAHTVWKGYLSSVQALETPDERTVVVKYAAPYAPALATWTLGILPAHAFQGVALTDARTNREPIGTGPYKLARWEPGKRMILQANDAWWYGPPRLATIELRFDIQDQLAALRRGEIHFAEIPDIGQWSNQAQLPIFRERFEVSDVVEPRLRLIAWNCGRKPLDDRRVREALTHALDRARIIDDLLLGQARWLSAPYFPTTYGADPAIAPHPYDLSRAGQLLDEAGWKRGDDGRMSLSLIALRSHSRTDEEALAIYRHDLAELGIKLQVSFLDPRSFFEKIVLRDYDAVYYGWLPDIPDGDPYALLHSSQIGTGPNYAGYASVEADQLLEQARATADRNQRKLLYHRLHALLHRDVPYTVVYAPYGHYAWHRALRGVNPADLGSQPRFPGVAGWWLETPEQAAKTVTP